MALSSLMMTAGAASVLSENATEIINNSSLPNAQAQAVWQEARGSLIASHNGVYALENFSAAFTGSGYDGINFASANYDAAESKTIYCDSIPVECTPGATIEFTSEGVWEIVSIDNCTVNYNDSIEADEETLESRSCEVNTFSREEADALVERIHKEAEDLPVYQLKMEDPVVGMRVTYDNFGNVDEIYLQDTTGEYSNITRALSQGTRKAPGVYTYGKVESNNVGYTTNTITIVGTSTGHVLGEGDFTVFTDKIGDHDNTLKRGDCATRGDMDNPQSGTSIRARNMTNDTVYNFTKNDNGALYNAVLDIWKTGVADLGITSTDYDNIKFAGRYYYEF